MMISRAFASAAACFAMPAFRQFAIFLPHIFRFQMPAADAIAAIFLRRHALSGGAATLPSSFHFGCFRRRAPAARLLPITSLRLR